MGLLSGLKDRLTGQRPAICVDPVLGVMENVANAMWQSTQPVILLDDMEPVDVLAEAEAPEVEHVGLLGGEVFQELRWRYESLRSEIAKLICAECPRVSPCLLWEHAVLVEVEILRDPATREVVLGLHYQIVDEPEWLYIVRVQGWKPLGVTIAG